MVIFLSELSLKSIIFGISYTYLTETNTFIDILPSTEKEKKCVERHKGEK